MYEVKPLVQGFPGKSASHGAFGWSSVWLLDDGQRRVLIDAGQPAYVPLIHESLTTNGLTAADITDVVLTHLHWDHVANFTMFPNAVTWVGEEELRWAAEQPSGTRFIPDLHVKELLNRRDNVERIKAGTEILPGIHTIAAAGHTPHHLAFYAGDAAEARVFAGDSVKNVFELTTLHVDSTMDAEASTATVRRLRSLMKDTGASLVPGHDVELRLDVHGVGHRQAPQRASIGYFADRDGGEQDRSIS